MKKTVWVFVFSLFLFSQEEKTVVSIGEYISTDLTSEQGFNKAVEEAIQNAIENYVGVTVHKSTESSQRNNDDQMEKNYNSFLNIFSNATVKSQKILKTRIETIKEDEKSIPKYVVEVELTLVIDTDGFDEGFTSSITLNEPVYKHGDYLQVSVQSSKDAYITILNFTEDNQVFVMYPNTLMPQTLIKANNKLVVPSDEEIKKGIVFELENASDKNSTSEIIMVIATKEQVPIISTIDEVSGLETVTIENFRKWLAGIKLKNRAMDSKLYTIYKKS